MGLEFREKVSQMKSCSILSSVSLRGWQWGTGLTLEHNGSDTILMACSPLEAQRWNCLWSPGVKEHHTFSSWNNTFTYIDYKGNKCYYLKLHLSLPSTWCVDLCFLPLQCKCPEGSTPACLFPICAYRGAQGWEMVDAQWIFTVMTKNYFSLNSFNHKLQTSI